LWCFPVAVILDPNLVAQKLESILIDAGEVVVVGLDTAFSQKISSSEWPWPGPTKRRNGQTVTSPRDIIDTGELDSSQRLTRPKRGTWIWLWTAPYALFVHEGATLRGGGEYPARPWTKAAVAEYQPGDKFAQEVKRRV
jgi:hypothetical protein